MITISNLTDIHRFIAEFPLGIIFHNCRGEIEYVNAEAENILGIKSSQVKGKKSIANGIDPDGNPFSEDKHPSQIALKTGVKVENVILGIHNSKLNKLKWLKINSVPQFDSLNKKVLSVFSVFEDVTDKVETERSLVESERAMLSFMDNLPGMAYRCKIDENWTMQFVSKGCLELTGYPYEAFIYNKTIPFLEIIHPDDRIKVSQNILTSVENRSTFDVEYRIITADNHIKFVREHGKAIYENNLPVFLEGILEDITEQKSSEQQLIEKELAISSSINAVALTDLTGRMTYVNTSFLKMWGYEAEDEILGKMSLEFWNSPYKVKRVINILLEKGTWQGELVAVKKNRKKFIVLLSASLIYDGEGKPLKMMASFINISKEKRLQDDLKRKLIYEKTISNVSSLFIGSFRLNKAINKSFEEIGRALQASHVFMFQINSSGKLVNNTHEWCAPGELPNKHLMQNLPLSDFPWWTDKLLKNEAIQIKKVSLMPEQAASEKKILKELNIKSLLVLPLYSKKKLLGFFGFDYVDEFQTWDHDDLVLLRMLENIFANAFSRKKAEKKLQLSERKFRQLFFNHTAPKLIIDPSSGDIVEVNSSAASFLGWTMEELESMNFIQLNAQYPELVKKSLEHIKTVRQFNTSFQIRLQDNSVKCIEVFCSMIKIKNKDMIHAIFFDVSEKKQLEKMLILFRKAIEQSPESIIITDRKSNILFVNPMFLQNTGYSAENVLGKKVNEFKSGVQDDKFYDKLWKTIAAGDNWYGEIVNKKKNGELYWEEVSISPIVNEKQEITHFVAIKQDVTEKKKNELELIHAKERAEESDRLKSSFLASISHELRTPLNIIIGFSNIICEITKDKTLGEYSKAINNSGLNLLEIVENLFSVAFDEHHVNLKPTSFQLRELSDLLLKQLRKQVEIANKTELIQLVVTSDDKLLEKNVTADLNKINQVMINLFKNAVKFTEYGRIELKINAVNPSSLILSVKDTGIGIPVNKQDILFQIFRQVDDSHSRKYDGVGIGLAVAQKLAKAMNGNITCSSEPGKGSEFSFFLQVEWKEENVQEKNRETYNFDHSLLIVEDDSSSRLLMEKLLSVTGAKIYIAENGQEAVDIVKSGKVIDLILMDMKMPVMSGYEATAIIKSINSSIPIIALTAYSFEDEKIKIKQAGCDLILTKPVRRNVLLDTLSKYLKKQVN